MPDTVTGFRRVRDRLRARGFVVIEVPHWETRGKGQLVPVAKVNHHTAGGQRGGNAASLRLVTYGREGLRNALCNWYTARNGDLYIVAALTAWHAGSGSWGGVSGNSRVIGNEAENDGLGEPWSPRSLAAQRALDEECVREFGYGVHMIPEHKEWTSRKPDRAGIHGPTYRNEVAAGLRHVHVETVTPPAPKPPPPPPVIEEDDMIVLLLKDTPHRFALSGGEVRWIDGDTSAGLQPKITEGKIVMVPATERFIKSWNLNDEATIAKLDEIAGELRK